MGKSARAKKAKKADFVKVKIKVGKKLKKAQNETKTDFKARKIILKEQLSLKSTESLVTKKKHDMKELISRLSYHNVYVRQDGINGLRELINSYDSALLIPHLSTFITRVAPCILDPDPLIRNTAVKFMETLIMKMGPSIEPYFVILSTHLACAMVHLNVGVQGDSLQVMKVLIKHTPKLVARHANTVLSSFLNLIERKATSSNQESKTSSQPAAIKSNNVPFSFSSLLVSGSNRNPLAGHKGRLSLLVELNNLLEAVLVEHGRVQEDLPYHAWDTVLDGSVPPVACDINMNDAEELWLFSDVNKLEKFTRTVIRLLMQLWNEIDSSSEKDASAGGYLLNEEGVETMSCIVGILMHIWRITQICTQEHPKKCKWLKFHFGSRFMRGVMSGFPFCCQVTPTQKKKKKKENENQKTNESSRIMLKHCDDLNVLLALFGTEMGFKSYREKSVNFFSRLLRDGNRDGQYNMKSVIKILTELLPPATKNELQIIINAAHTCFARLHPLKKDRALLLELLLKITDHSHADMWDYATVHQWIEDIVKDFAAGDVRESLLQAAIELRLKNNTNIKSLLIKERKKISDAVKTKGIQGLSPSQVELKLQLLLTD